MSKIQILIGGHLCTAPRPQKEACTLHKAGYEVIVKGVWFDQKKSEEDLIISRERGYKFEPALDFRYVTKISNIKTRFLNRFSKLLLLRANIFLPYSLGYGGKELLRSAKNENADITIVHSALGLWIADNLLESGNKVGIDFEDWFSEDFPCDYRSDKLTLKIKELEKKIAYHSHYCLTTSKVLADAIADTYNVPLPTVVYNVFPYQERSTLDNKILDRRNTTIPSLHWFSQTVGPGRGLETLMKSLKHLLTPCEVHIRGKYTESTALWLRNLVPKEWKSRIFFHQPVTNNELLSRISEHDIGLALESDSLVNKDLTISNKFFQYMQAGLAIIATDTQGQKEIFHEFPNIGIMVQQNNSRELAQAITMLVTNPGKLALFKKNSLEACKTRYSWEKEEDIIRELINSTIKAKRI